MFYTDDPARDFDRWDMEQARAEARLPVCECCGEHIQDETAFHYNGVWICDSCIESHKEWVEDYAD
jgi:formylmethanofuran dehydrogenase subunit E